MANAVAAIKAGKHEPKHVCVCYEAGKRCMVHNRKPHACADSVGKLVPNKTGECNVPNCAWHPVYSAKQACLVAPYDGSQPKPVTRVGYVPTVVTRYVAPPAVTTRVMLATLEPKPNNRHGGKPYTTGLRKPQSHLHER
jgi:hypothetical protein